MVWVALFVITLLAVAIALWPLAFGRSKPNDAGSEAAFYRAQLAEIDRDVERGQLPSTEAAAARAEAARRLIAADAAASAETPRRDDGSRRRVAALLAAALIPVVGAGVYARFGQPGLPDAPLASRNSDPSAPDAIEAAVAQVEAEASASPDNVKAWSALAPVYLRLGRYDDAVAAYRQLLRLKGEDGETRANLAEAQVAAAGGTVTAEARAMIDKALADNPNLPMARFYLGLAAEQEGDKAKAIQIYQPLVEATSDHPHWQDIVKGRLAALKGEAPAQAESASPGGDGAAATSNAASAAGGQQDMIRGMVARLASRLTDRGGSAEDWTRLVRSYAVLNQPDKARDALASARKALAADASGSAALEALARELNLASP